MAALEAKADQSESEMSSVKTLVQSMVQTMQGMQNIMSLNMATAITTDSRESPKLLIAGVLGQLGHQSPGTVLVVNGQAQPRAVIR